MLAVVAFLPTMFFIDSRMAAVVSLTLLAVCTLATLVGSLLPLLARRAGFDPAVMSAPFISTLVDASGLIVYFLIAKVILGI
jgi:magnesium transporter